MDPSEDNGGGRPVTLTHDADQAAGRAGGAGRGGRDGFAVAALICGLLALIPLALIFGVVALIRIARAGTRGRALAITGLVLAGLWAIGGAAAATALLTHHAKPRPAALPQIFQLHAGQCLNSAPNEISGVHVVHCAKPHDGEVFGTFQVAGAGYPGAAGLQRQASIRCVRLLGRYLNPQLSLSSLTESYVYPDAGAWAAGERTVVCTVRSTAGQITGSVRTLPK
jgi:hypothetical protein